MSLVQARHTCRVCRGEADFLWTAPVLKKHSACYYECRHCGYVQTEMPFWLDEAYSEAINLCDTGIMARNVENARKTLMIVLALGLSEESLVDYAGGYGILVRLLRDYGLDAFWADRYCENLMARGFEYKNGPAGFLTAFEAFEHFVDPVSELRFMFKLAPNVLISTSLIADPTPGQGQWWYYGGNHGQHIGFFRIRTLQKIARDFGKHLYSDGERFHLFLDKPISGIYWRLMLRFSRFSPMLARFKLKGKTWGDHVLLSSGDK